MDVQGDNVKCMSHCGLGGGEGQVAGGMSRVQEARLETPGHFWWRWRWAWTMRTVQ